jgi:hypothetical protein
MNSCFRRCQELPTLKHSKAGFPDEANFVFGIVQLLYEKPSAPPTSEIDKLLANMHRKSTRILFTCAVWEMFISKTFGLSWTLEVGDTEEDVESFVGTVSEIITSLLRESHKERDFVAVRFLVDFILHLDCVPVGCKQGKANTGSGISYGSLHSHFRGDVFWKFMQFWQQAFCDTMGEDRKILFGKDVGLQAGMLSVAGSETQKDLDKLQRTMIQIRLQSFATVMVKFNLDVADIGRFVKQILIDNHIEAEGSIFPQEFNACWVKTLLEKSQSSPVYIAADLDSENDLPDETRRRAKTTSSGSSHTFLESKPSHDSMSSGGSSIDVIGRGHSKTKSLAAFLTPRSGGNTGTGGSSGTFSDGTGGEVPASDMLMPTASARSPLKRSKTDAGRLPPLPPPSFCTPLPLYSVPLLPPPLIFPPSLPFYSIYSSPLSLPSLHSARTLFILYNPPPPLPDSEGINSLLPRTNSDGSALVGVKVYIYFFIYIPIYLYTHIPIL